jgi:hypothetical protein
MVPVLKHPLFTAFSVALAALFLVGCAGQVPPGGGPLDTTPPVVIRTVPDTNATRVNTSGIEIEFSEYVDRRTVEESIFISPYLGKLEFDWGTTDVTITFKDTLRKNTTYVVSIGTDVADVRANNRMAQGYTLAFSTGDSLDHGSIRGRVSDEAPAGVMMFAYNLAGIDPDTLNPAHVKPDYIMQTGTDGRFQFRNIALSTYRIIAVRDEYKNYIYDREVDAFGVGQGDITLTRDHPVYDGLQFRLAKEDTTLPFVSSVTAYDRMHLTVRFSEPVDTLTFPRATLALADTFGRGSLRTGARVPDMGNTAILMIELSDPLDSTATYRLRINGIQDLAGNTLDTVHSSTDFPGSGSPDTLRVKVSIRNVADSSRGIPIGSPFAVNFGRPVSLGPAMASVKLLDSTKHVVPVTVAPRTPAEIFVTPGKPLLSMAWYSLRVTLDSLVDAAGNRIKDSTARIDFQTMDLRSTGTIDGQILDQTPGGPAVVTAHTVDMTPPRKSSVTVKTGNTFGMKELLEGKYRIDGYRDEDGNGQYSPGRPYPFKHSERFGVYPDTVKVRARWGIDGVILKIIHYP